MVENIYDKMIVHLDLVKFATKCSLAISQCVEEGNFDELNFHMENRDRVIGQIQTFQDMIESSIRAVPAEFVTAQFSDIVKAWSHDINHWLEDIKKIDDYILCLLDKEKGKTQKEIAEIFQVKKAYKGYDLSSVR